MSSTMASLAPSCASAVVSASTSRPVAAPRVTRTPTWDPTRESHATLSTGGGVWSTSRVRSVLARGWNPLSVLAPPDISGDLLASVATLVLKGVLREWDDVSFVVDCSVMDLLGGKVDGVQLSGAKWVSPLNLTCESLRCDVGAVEIDPIALVSKQAVELRTIPVGDCVVRFSAIDFGNFLVHPEMRRAAKDAGTEWGFDFDFHGQGIVLKDGAVVFSGTRGGGGGERCVVAMTPVGPRSVEVTRVDGPCGDETTSALERFFGELAIDLLGAEVRYGDMVVDDARVTLSLTMRVLRFPSSLQGLI